MAIVGTEKIKRLLIVDDTACFNKMTAQDWIEVFIQNKHKLKAQFISTTHEYEMDHQQFSETPKKIKF